MNKEHNSKYSLASLYTEMKNSFVKLGPACQPPQSRDKLAYQPEFKRLEPTRRGLVFNIT